MSNSEHLTVVPRIPARPEESLQALGCASRRAVGEHEPSSQERSPLERDVDAVLAHSRREVLHASAAGVVPLGIHGQVELGSCRGLLPVVAGGIGLDERGTCFQRAPSFLPETRTFASETGRRS